MALCKLVVSERQRQSPLASVRQCALQPMCRSAMRCNRGGMTPARRKIDQDMMTPTLALQLAKHVPPCIRTCITSSAVQHLAHFLQRQVCERGDGSRVSCWRQLLCKSICAQSIRACAKKPATSQVNTILLRLIRSPRTVRRLPSAGTLSRFMLRSAGHMSNRCACALCAVILQNMSSPGAFAA